MAKKEKAQKQLYKKWWFWVIVVSLVGAVGTGLSGGGTTDAKPSDAPPPPVETQKGETEQEPVVTPEPSASQAPADSTPETPADLDLDALSAEILSAIPAAYQGSDWNNVTCDEGVDGFVFVIMQVDQKSDDADAALSLAGECYAVAREKVEGAGASLDSVSTTVVNNGAALGIYATENGKDFTLISDGKRTEVSLP